MVSQFPKFVPNSCEETGKKATQQRVYSLSLLLLPFLLLPPVFCAAQQSPMDLDGNSVKPFTSNAGHSVVLLFVRGDCPISGRYAPTIQRISREHQNDVRFYLVFPDKSERLRTFASICTITDTRLQPCAILTTC